MWNLFQIGIALDQSWSWQGGEPQDRRRSMSPSSKSFLTVEQLEEGRGENSVEAMAAQREEKRGENSMEATVLEILFFWLGTQDSQFFLAPKARKSRHFLHRDKSA